MNDRSKQFTLILLGVAIMMAVGCATTTRSQLAGPSQAALHQHGISEGDAVLVRYTNIDDARSSSRSELLHITGISGEGIAGTNEGGADIAISYDEVFQFERKYKERAGPAHRTLPPQVVKTAKNAARALGAIIYVYVSALGGGP